MPPAHLSFRDQSLAAKQRKAYAAAYEKPSQPIDPRIIEGLVPVSWADDRFFPPKGNRCSCCKGIEFWSRGSGWCCSVCHPPPYPADVLFRSVEV